jgi:hypothetical protein
VPVGCKATPVRLRGAGGRAIHSAGIAGLFLDGVFVERINTYEPFPIEGYQHTVFRADGLTQGTHTLTIESAGNGGFIVVDAFDVRP